MQSPGIFILNLSGIILLNQKLYVLSIYTGHINQQRVFIYQNDILYV